MGLRIWVLLLYMQIEKLKCFTTNEEVGDGKLNVQNDINSTQRTQTQEENLQQDQWLLLGGLQSPLRLYYSCLSFLNILRHAFDK